MKNNRADVFVASVAEYMISVHPSATNNRKNVLKERAYVSKNAECSSFIAARPCIITLLGHVSDMM